MMRHISRRKLLGGAAGVGVLTAAGMKMPLPPATRGVFGVSDALTYAAHKALLVNQPLARELGREHITPKFPVNGPSPQEPGYLAAAANGFADWRLPVEGLIARPASLSLGYLKGLPARTQVTQQSCEEGWSAVAEWTGVPLSKVLHELGAAASARYVLFETTDGWWDSLDMDDALHPQTLLAYGMNGGDLPVAYGAPLRLRVERQLGYKNLKYLSRMLVTDRVDNIRDGTGSGSFGASFPWYAGI